jgi:hypothetical protein
VEVANYTSFKTVNFPSTDPTTAIGALSLKVNTYRQEGYLQIIGENVLKRKKYLT